MAVRNENKVKLTAPRKSAQDPSLVRKTGCKKRRRPLVEVQCARGTVDSSPKEFLCQNDIQAPRTPDKQPRLSQAVDWIATEFTQQPQPSGCSLAERRGGRLTVLKLPSTNHSPNPLKVAQAPGHAEKVPGPPGWFDSCRGCGCRTGHEYQVATAPGFPHATGMLPEVITIPVCGACRSQLHSLAGLEGSLLHCQLLRIHLAWVGKGL
ncbi:hypothetical protein V8C86DRAFT_2451163 [Haematococcus lacustris]